ncbi:MAG: PDZ domain-containing protein [Candidatus Melainabacteria bacterium]|nr:PDZ domain-containing protein [Candidatus Melainabacteria bacterium]
MARTSAQNNGDDYPQYGYYRHATIWKEKIYFVCEDDIWECSLKGGLARRFTAGQAEFSFPRVSPDGKHLAFVGKEEGHPEIYVTTIAGGNPTRLTYMHSDAIALTGWSQDSKKVHFTSDARTPFFRSQDAFSVARDGGNPECFNWGHVCTFHIATGPGRKKVVVVGRNNTDPARWKRYKGGTKGEIWIDPTGQGKFNKLVDVEGNSVWPMVIGTRVYFLSDHEGVGNIYSCRFDGKDLRKETNQTEYYVRFPSTDGSKITYTAGGDIYLFDPARRTETKVNVIAPLSTHQTKRKVVEAIEYLEHFSPHPDGHSVGLIARGQPIIMGNWEGPVNQYGDGSRVRYRNLEWLPEGNHFVVINDRDGYEKLELHDCTKEKPPVVLTERGIGRTLSVKVSPCGKMVAMSNHRHELLLVNIRKDEEKKETDKGKSTRAKRMASKAPLANANSTFKILDKSPAERIDDFNWSPDCQWITYSFATHPGLCIIRVVHVATGAIYDITDPVRFDARPCFDPDGKYIYFLGARNFYPVADSMSFAYGFPRVMRPFLVTLRKDIPSPFLPKQKPLARKGTKAQPQEQPQQTEPKQASRIAQLKDAISKLPETKVSGKSKSATAKAGMQKIYKEALKEAFDIVLRELERTGIGTSTRTSTSSAKTAAANSKTGAKTKKAGAVAPNTPPQENQPTVNSASNVEIDFDGITNRILAFPAAEGKYGQIIGVKNRALFTLYPVRGIRPDHSWYDDDQNLAVLMAYDFEDRKQADMYGDVGYMSLALDGQTIYYKTRRGRIRAFDSAEKMPAEGRGPAYPQGSGKDSGFLDLTRAQVIVNPRAEWAQMYDEAWRLQKEQFWVEDMSRINWDQAGKRYQKLLPRVRTRSEVSDLIWELHGELGTSHAYEMGGDYRWAPYYRQGFLGCDCVWNAQKNAYEILQVLKGDSWEPEAASPLGQTGISLQPGDCIYEVNGIAVNEHSPLEELLFNHGGKEVTIAVLRKEKKREKLVVKPLRNERALRYRDWVQKNSAYVHEKTNGEIGYVHIPDMGPYGFAEFHRHYMAEVNRKGLIIDVRYNRGGHVSALLLEKLNRKIVGYDVNRWGPPQPYPPESLAGPMVAITNEFAGSDGDIFSHCFKLYKLGPLVGKRTWGGVIGIYPRHRLVDRTITTQPEFSFWFQDVGWKVENYGVEPDIEVDITPQDYHQGKDPQLDTAINMVAKQLKLKPPSLPEFSDKPDLSHNGKKQVTQRQVIKRPQAKKGRSR